MYGSVSSGYMYVGLHRHVPSQQRLINAWGPSLPMEEEEEEEEG
jgi:hypothetical protein